MLHVPPASFHAIPAPPRRRSLVDRDALLLAAFLAASLLLMVLGAATGAMPIDDAGLSASIPDLGH